MTPAGPAATAGPAASAATAAFAAPTETPAAARAPSPAGLPVPATAVLLLAYGSPDSLDDVEAYYTDVRGGRRPSPEALAVLRARYERLGGGTPLLRLTRALADGLQAALGPAYGVHVGMRHWQPRIGAAVADIVRQSAQRLVALPLAPHYSRLSIGAYRQAVEAGLEAAGEPAPRLVFIERWHDRPAFHALIASRVRDALAAFPSEARAGGIRLVFTAHSLPERIREWNDPYPEELRASAAAIAQCLGTDDWELAYQSAGRTPEPWLGPGIDTVIHRLAAAGRRDVLVVPFGFTCDHLEVLYDLDVEARALAESAGVRLRRTAMPNADPDYVALLAELVRERSA